MSRTSLELLGVTEKCRGTLSYLVKLQNNKMVRRHVDHVKIHMSNNDVTDISDCDDFLLIGGQLHSPAVEQSELSCNCMHAYTVL